MELNRNMTQITAGSRSTKTVTFPVTVRKVRDGAFGRGNLLRSVVMNEGLERLGVRA